MKQFSSLIIKERSARWRSAKAFFSEKAPPCSYYHYLQVENGGSVSAVLAAAIAERLEIPLKVAMYAWSADQMPTSELEGMFSLSQAAVLAATPCEMKAMGADRLLPINRMQATLLAEIPLTIEILTYLSIFRAAYSADHMAAALRSNVESTEAALQKMYDYGLIDRAEGKFQSKREHVTIPPEEDLEFLQRSFFERAVDAFKTHVAAGKPPVRATLTRLLSEEQFQDVADRMRALRNFVWSLPDPPEKRAKPYVLGVFAIERDYENQ